MFTLVVTRDDCHVERWVATTNEWNLLKHQFDALVHAESVEADSIEKTLDDQTRRRFAEMINRAVEGRTSVRVLRGS
jgi:hypothetical protein